MRRSARWCCALLVLVAAPAAAQNVVVNSDFATDVAGWELGQGAAMGWIPDDEAECPQSGSLAVVASGMTITFAAVNTCAELPPAAATVSYAMRYRGGGFGMTPMVGFYDGPGCAGNYLGPAGGATAPASPGAWSSTEAAGLAVPAGAVSARLTATSSGSSAFELDVDRVYLGVMPRVFSDDFEADPPGPALACRWSAASP